MTKREISKNKICLLKRLGFILAVFVLLFSVPAYADIIYEPNDDFYQQHIDECETTYYWKAYKVISDSAVLIVRSPEDDTVVGEYKPGVFFSTNTSYQSGDTIWYYLTDFDHPDKAGWISNAGIEQIYDTDCFTEDHISELQGTVKLDIKKLKEITFCAYPGGHQIDTRILQNQTDETLTCEGSYTDPEGKVWGYCGYFYGPVNGWVCLDDPTLANTDTADPLTISEVRGESPSGQETETDTVNESTKEEDDTSKPETSSETIESSVSDTNAEETKEPEKTNGTVNPLIIVGILAGTAVLTAAIVLIVVLKRK
ncbi:MAG: hypothetical protein IKS18_04940 [Lachnospiraceae bacterium]|nr:hypothetical protein [Lachnospiraceae bacterium]